MLKTGVWRIYKVTGKEVRKERLTLRKVIHLSIIN